MKYFPVEFNEITMCLIEELDENDILFRFISQQFSSIPVIAITFDKSDQIHLQRPEEKWKISWKVSYQFPANMPHFTYMRKKPDTIASPLSKNISIERPFDSRFDGIQRKVKESK